MRYVLDIDIEIEDEKGKTVFYTDDLSKIIEGILLDSHETLLEPADNIVKDGTCSTYLKVKKGNTQNG